jgi:glutamine synthetase
MIKLPENILSTLTRKFVEDTGLSPIMSTEIEFYLKGAGNTLNEDFAKACYEAFLQAGIMTYEFTKERADEQYEISLFHISDPERIAQNTVILKEIIKQTAKTFRYKAIFDAKPFKDLPGNGLHIHLSLKNADGSNIFGKEKGEDEEAEFLKYAVGGMCELLPESMLCFAPKKKSFKRFTAKLNEGKGVAQYNNAPVNVSWGGNNRTVAIRIPASTHFPESRHLEHRVAGADADPTLAIAAVLAGAHFGITNTTSPGEKVYGNAYDGQYNLPELPPTHKEAKKLFKKRRILLDYL